jgi:uncharacterized protein YqeY
VTAVPGIESRLRDALKQSMRARDKAAVSALRTTLAAIDNAGAVEVADAAPASLSGDEHVAGSRLGVGAAEAERRELSEAELVALVRAEVTEREASATEYERHGESERAAGLRHEASVLAGVLAAASS